MSPDMRWNRGATPEPEGAGPGEERNAIRESAHAAPVERLLLDARGVAVALGISESNFVNLRVRGLLPAPRRLDGALRWDVAELRAWVAWGCPPRKRWELFRGYRGGPR